LDFSGKKALDYQSQKQLTSISAHTFSSEYARTLPHQTTGKSGQSIIQRSYSTIFDESIRYFFDSPSSSSGSNHNNNTNINISNNNNKDDTTSIYSEAGTIGSFSGRRKSKRYRSSILRKSKKT
jgi:hypothetical protein